MSYWSHLKTALAQKASDLAGAPVAPEAFVNPPKPDMGDLALGCFPFAKAMGKNPAEAAEVIAAGFHEAIPGVRAKALGPFVNFIFDAAVFSASVAKDVLAAPGSFGAGTAGEGKTVMVEYAQPNTHKEMHVGHLRNLVLGAAVIRLLRHASWDVVAASYHGDVGAHVAKCLWWMVTEAGKSPGELTEKEVDEILSGLSSEKQTGEYLGSLYAASTREIEARGDTAKVEVSAVLQALEAHAPAWEKLWRETRQWSLTEMSALFEELGAMIDRQYLESEVVDEGQRIVDDLLKKGVAKESQGAIVVDLEEKKLGVFLIRKSDGTSLYATKDLALAYLKHREYPALDRSILVVDNRQMLYFQQLFETLKQMGYPVTLEHVGYEFVTLKDGAMSSREGNVVTYQSFREEVLAKTRQEVAARHDDWEADKKEMAARAIAHAGMMFGMLRQDSEKIFTFDADQALSFEGDTGPYVQYAVVRLSSILRKAGGQATPSDAPHNAHDAEKALALSLAQFEDVCRRAAAELRPNILAQWCVETAHRANAFYRDVPVLDAPNEDRVARLNLVAAARDTLTLALGLLGVPVPEEM